MEIETWLAFVVVSLVLLATPGPIALFAISSSLSFGRTRALPVVYGAMLGDFIAMTASLLGIGALLATAPMAYSGIKIAGSTFLIYLGVKTIVRAGRFVAPENIQKNVAPTTIFWGGFSLALLHPSGFIFFTSFAPQFINQDRPFFSQASILVLSFLIIGGITTLMWLLIADRTRILLSNHDVHRRVQYLSGVTLVLFGLIAAIFAFE